MGVALTFPTEEDAARIAAMDAARARELEAVSMRETCSVEGCGRRLRSNNTTGICAKCQAHGHRKGRPRKGTRSLPASARTVVVQPGASPQHAAGAAAPRLLKAASFDPSSLTDEELAACIHEARARLKAREVLREALEARDGRGPEYGDAHRLRLALERIVLRATLCATGREE